MTTQSNTTVLLVGARDLIENVGWHRGEMEKREGGKVVGYCLFGALVEASTLLSPEGRRDWGSTDSAVILLREIATPWWKAWFKGKDGIVSWNDEPGRKKEEVIKLLDKGIEVSLKRQAA